MKENLLKLINEKSPGSQPLLLVIRGSHAYGTNVETSDTDYAGVFIQPLEDILGFGYKEQINDDKNDIVIYEIGRFLKLLSSNNPTVLELLNTPKNCIIYKHPIFDEIINNREKFFFVIIIFLYLFLTFLETVGISLVVPAIYLLSDYNQTNFFYKYLNDINIYFNFSNILNIFFLIFFFFFFYFFYLNFLYLILLTC